MSPRNDVTLVLRLERTAYRALLQHCDRLEVQAHDLVSKLVERAVTENRSEDSARPRIDDAILRRIADLNQSGESDNSIARVLGVSQPTVSKYRARLGLRSNHRRIGEPRGDDQA